MKVLLDFEANMDVQNAYSCVRRKLLLANLDRSKCEINTNVSLQMEI